MGNARDLQQTLDNDRLATQRALAQITTQLAAANGTQIIKASMEEGERFSGAEGESVLDWIRKVERRSTVEGWNGPNTRKAAVGALTGRALTWNDLVGSKHTDWTDWRRAIIRTFSEELTESQWNVKVETRKQGRGEPGRSYVMDKVILLRQRTVPLTEEEMIPYLVRGLLDPLQKSAVMARDIVTVDELLAELRRLESYNYVSNEDSTGDKQDTGPKVEEVKDHSREIADLSAQLRSLRSYVRNQPMPPQNPLTLVPPPLVPAVVAPAPLLTGANTEPIGRSPLLNYTRRPREHEECYRCHMYGHYARDCPTNPVQGNGRAGPAGQGQQ